MHTYRNPWFRPGGHDPEIYRCETAPRTMNRTALLTSTDAGYVVSHADVRSGEHLDTAITLTQRVELEIEDRGHEMVLPERAKRPR